MATVKNPGKKQTSAVVRVGEGRGFVVEGRRGRLIITAGHCLPKFPDCASFLDPQERTYQSLLGPLGKPTEVWGQLLFADPVADIAILGSPDGEELFDQAEAYEAMVDEATPLPTSGVSAAPETFAYAPAWLLSLDAHWFRCKAEYWDSGPLWLSEATEGIRGGMSGSPILTIDGSAIGVLSAACGAAGEVSESGEFSPQGGGPEPRLDLHLPAWVLREIEGPLAGRSRTRRKRSTSKCGDGPTIT